MGPQSEGLALSRNAHCDNAHQQPPASSKNCSDGDHHFSVHGPAAIPARRRCNMGSMTPTEKIRAAFDQLAKRKPAALYEGSSASLRGSAWLIEALSLVEATFGEGHATQRAMRAAVDYVLANAAYGPDVHRWVARANSAEGAFEAAKQIVDSDNLDGLIDIVRAATEADLLGQAETLLDGGAIAAAAVIAGGALETHLSGLIARFAIPWQQHGDRGIATYNNAVASCRKKNPSLPLYSPATGDLISGWAKMRNQAAHEPLVFATSHKVEGVTQMIDGIRLVISGTQ